MRNINIKSLILLIFFNIIYFFSCSKKDIESFIPSLNGCDSINRVDSLLKDVLSKEYIFKILKDDTSKINYLISDELIIPQQIYFRFDSLLIIPVNKDSIVNKHASRFLILDVNFNNDTTSAALKVDFISRGLEFAVRTDFNYLFDTLICKWFLKDSTLYEY